MKKNLLSVIALTLAAAGLASSLVLWNTLNQIRGEMAALMMQMDVLVAGAVAPDPGVITLSAAPRDDGSVAVTLTLESAEEVIDAAPALIVMQNDSLVSQVPCFREGNICTATTALPIDDGYTYILAYGGWEYLVASPDNGAYPQFVNLADSMSAYCNLVLGEWIVLDGRLTLDTCHLHVQLPLLSTQDAPSSINVRLILRYNNETFESYDIALMPGEGQAGYEASPEELSFSLPDLAEGEEVDLWIEADLPGGEVIRNTGGSWTATSDGFVMAAG